MPSPRGGIVNQVQVFFGTHSFEIQIAFRVSLRLGKTGPDNLPLGPFDPVGTNITDCRDLAALNLQQIIDVPRTLIADTDKTDFYEILMPGLYPIILATSERA